MIARSPSSRRSCSSRRKSRVLFARGQPDGPRSWLPELESRLVVGVSLAIFQQITGINAVIYYAPTIIQLAGVPSASGAILATAGIGAVNVLLTIVAMLLLNRVGC